MTAPKWNKTTGTYTYEAVDVDEELTPEQIAEIEADGIVNQDISERMFDDK